MNVSELFKAKSRDSYHAAEALRHSNVNSAASRLYYSLYQAVVGEFELKGIRPKEIDRASADNRSEESLKWKHSFVCNNASLAGLDTKQRQTLRNALSFRIQADYLTQAVIPFEFDKTFREARNILECLGVPI